MAVFRYRMPSGIAGTYNRAEHLTAEAGLLLSTAVPTAYGQAVAVDPASGRYRLPTTGDDASKIVGIVLRPYPDLIGSVSDGMGNLMGLSAITTHTIARRGYIMATVGGTVAAAKGGTVYVRIAAPAPGKPIGGLEAAADGSNTVAMPSQTYWMGPADALGNGEVAWNI